MDIFTILYNCFSKPFCRFVTLHYIIDLDFVLVIIASCLIPHLNHVITWRNVCFLTGR